MAPSSRSHAPPSGQGLTRDSQLGPHRSTTGGSSRAEPNLFIGIRGDRRRPVSSPCGCRASQRPGLPLSPGTGLRRRRQSGFDPAGLSGASCSDPSSTFSPLRFTIFPLGTADQRLRSAWRRRLGAALRRDLSLSRTLWDSSYGSSPELGKAGFATSSEATMRLLVSAAGAPPAMIVGTHRLGRGDAAARRVLAGL
jgi:hypothetical protein